MQQTKLAARRRPNPPDFISLMMIGCLFYLGTPPLLLVEPLGLIPAVSRDGQPPAFSLRPRQARSPCPYRLL